MTFMWIFMTIVNLIFPIVMIAVGILFVKFPPEKVNDFWGYRTAMSKKNQQTWDFAHKYSGEFWRKEGIITFPAVILIMLPAMGKSNDFVCYYRLAVSVVCTVLLLMVIPATERALRKKFNKDGSSKE